jgi:hypothetical protein
MISGKSEAGDDSWEDNRVTETFDWLDEDAVAVAVVGTVSTVTGREPTEMQPLAEVVDSEALGMLFATPGPGGESSHVQFEYENCLVRVSGDGTVAVTPVEQV